MNRGPFSVRISSLYICLLLFVYEYFSFFSQSTPLSFQFIIFNYCVFVFYFSLHFFIPSLFNFISCVSTSLRIPLPIHSLFPNSSFISSILCSSPLFFFYFHLFPNSSFISSILCSSSLFFYFHLLVFLLLTFAI